MEIASHRNAFSSRTLQLRKIVAQEHDSVAVIDDTIGGWVVGCAATVLRDVDFLDIPELGQMARRPIQRLEDDAMRGCDFENSKGSYPGATSVARTYFGT
jgi:hypothetical protein